MPRNRFLFALGLAAVAWFAWKAWEAAQAARAAIVNGMALPVNGPT